MSREDFLFCTPSEFRAIFDSWQQQQDRTNRTAWERTRMMCLCMLQPHSKKKMKARDVMEFPWEKKETKPQKQLSPEEYERVKRRYGIGLHSGQTADEQQHTNSDGGDNNHPHGRQEQG
jgi:hypothetical protein